MHLLLALRCQVGPAEDDSEVLLEDMGSFERSLSQVGNKSNPTEGPQVLVKLSFDFEACWMPSSLLGTYRSAPCPRA